MMMILWSQLLVSCLKENHAKKYLLLLPIYPTVKGRRIVASGYGGFNLWDTGTEQQCSQGTLVMEVWKNIFNINVLRKL